jgi:hypothetical protein
MVRNRFGVWTLVALGAAIGALGACDTGVANPAVGLPYVGNYDLLAVDGAPLPAAITSGFVVRGSLTLGTDVTFTLSETDSSGGTTSTLNASGQWSVLGSKVTMLASNADVYVGTLSTSNDTLSVLVGGHTDTYVK